MARMPSAFAQNSRSRMTHVHKTGGQWQSVAWGGGLKAPGPMHHHGERPCQVLVGFLWSAQPPSPGRNALRTVSMQCTCMYDAPVASSTALQFKRGTTQQTHGHSAPSNAGCSVHPRRHSVRTTMCRQLRGSVCQEPLRSVPVRAQVLPRPAPVPYGSRAPLREPAQHGHRPDLIAAQNPGPQRPRHTSHAWGCSRACAPAARPGAPRSRDAPFFPPARGGSLSHPYRGADGSSGSATATVCRDAARGAATGVDGAISVRMGGRPHGTRAFPTCIPPKYPAYVHHLRCRPPDSTYAPLLPGHCLRQRVTC